MNVDAVKRQIEESIPWRDGVLTVEQASLPVPQART